MKNLKYTKFILVSCLRNRMIPVGIVYTAFFSICVKRSVYILSNSCSEINQCIIMEMHSIMEKEYHICILWYKYINIVFNIQSYSPLHDDGCRISFVSKCYYVYGSKMNIKKNVERANAWLHSSEIKIRRVSIILTYWEEEIKTMLLFEK